MLFEGKNGPLLIAEIGGNHEGSFDIAIKQTLLAIKSGCDVVKFQMYKGEKGTLGSAERLFLAVSKISNFSFLLKPTKKNLLLL